MKQFGILVQQKSENGILGGQHCAKFSIKENNIIYEISIEQCGIRKTSIKTEASVDIETLVNIFNRLDMLIMLGDGEFIPISETKTIENHIEFHSEELNKLFVNRAKKFSSADFTRDFVNSFLSFDKYVNSKTFTVWSNLLCELDIAHNITLYSLADTGMTADCKCAFLIEVFEALSELLKEKIPDFTYRKAKKEESQLQIMLIAVLDKYGNDIFKEEMCLSKNKFTDCLVKSRNRIFHIKRNQGNFYLDGPESVLYAVKLSDLYRVVLLSLLNVEYGLYSEKLKKSIDNWNEWNDVLKRFLQKLNNH